MFRIQPRTAILALIILCVVVFERTLLAHFVLWDDDVHLFNNPFLVPVTLDHTLHFWLHPYENLYIPVSYTVYALLTLLAIRPAPADAGPFAGPSLSPGVYHAANLLLHCANVVLVFLILRCLTRRNAASAVGAALFAVHPLQVESVAWVSELRGLLCGVFSLGSIYAYITYARWTKAGDPKKLAVRSYAAAIVMMFLAMLSKPSAAPLPLVFFVIDRWAYERSWRTAAKMSLPWLLALFPIVHLTEVIQPTGSFFQIPIWQRLFVAGDALAFYLAKLVAPVNLITEYGRRPDVILATKIPYWDWVIPTAIAALLYFGRRSSRMYVVGGLIALAFILPVLGLAPFIYQRFSTVADRYCYLPMLGIALIVATLVAKRPGIPTWVASACVLLVFAGVSLHQVTYWDNTIKLLSHTVAVNPRSAGSWENLGGAYVSEANDAFAHSRSKSLVDGYNAIALRDFENSIKLNPQEPTTVAAIGDIYLRERNYPEAEKYLYRSLNMVSIQPKVRANLGEIFYQLGDADRAIAEYTASLQLDPASPQAREDLAGLYINKSDYSDAAETIEPVVKKFPKYEPAHKTLGIALDRLRVTQMAADQFSQAVAVDPNDPEAHLLLALSLLQLNKIPKGKAEIQEAHDLLDDPAEFSNEFRGALAALGLKLRHSSSVH